MGDIADMMLDGTLCQSCGVYIEDDDSGYPRNCPSCEREDELHEITRGAKKLAAQHKVKCPTCGKRVKPTGLFDHQRDAHGVTGAANSGGVAK